MELAATHWTDVVTSVATAVTAVGALAAVAGAWLAFVQLRDARKERESRAMAVFGRAWDGPELVDARRFSALFDTEDELRDAFLKARDDKSHDYFLFTRLLNFFEDLGTAAITGDLSLERIDEGLGAIVVASWSKWAPAIWALRGEGGDPKLYSNFENLASALTQLDGEAAA